MPRVSMTKQWRGAWTKISSVFRRNRGIMPDLDMTDRKQISRALLEVAHVLANAPNHRVSAAFSEKNGRSVTQMRIVVEGVGVIGIGRMTDE